MPHHHRFKINRTEVNEIKNIAILGSTGSIGTQTLDIIKEYPGLFKAYALVARTHWQELAAQAIATGAKKAIISDERYFTPLQDALKNYEIEVMAGSQAIEDLMEDEAIDLVVTAMVGYSGLASTLRAVEMGKDVALANKETLVAGGSLIYRALEKSKSSILPVDSEHSAIFQCLQGENRGSLHKIILTASGGPFRTTPAEEMKHITVADALKHPNWNMGAKVTIDSASMMNKGFEMIEARWLFGCPPEKIEIVVHPQSIVHSMVEFADGTIKAQLGVPDMRLPIRYALGYPERLPSRRQELSVTQYSTLTFSSPDYEKFPLLGFAFKAIDKGGNAPCALNAANEVAVAAFLKGELPFVGMPVLIAEAVDKTPFVTEPTYSDIIATHSEATHIALEIANKYK